MYVAPRLATCTHLYMKSSVDIDKHGTTRDKREGDGKFREVFFGRLVRSLSSTAFEPSQMNPSLADRRQLRTKSSENLRCKEAQVLREYVDGSRNLVAHGEPDSCTSHSYMHVCALVQPPVTYTGITREIDLRPIYWNGKYGIRGFDLPSYLHN